MSLAIIAPGKDRSPWVQAIKRLAPDIEIQVYPDISHPAEVTNALVWMHPYGILKQFPNLQCITSLGAGVDRILNDPTINEFIPITRIVDNNLSRDIARSAVLAVLSYENNLFQYRTYQKNAEWHPLPKQAAKTIGVIGLGQMGLSILESMKTLRYSLKGFSRTEKTLDGVDTYHGSSIPDNFLKDVDVLISVLPYTPETNRILNADLFNRVDQGTYLVNLGRGGHLVEEDLVKAIASKKISGAYLDVFTEEPLPPNHPFWKMSEITLTPHVASVTDPESASEIVVDNYRRMAEGRELLFKVDRKRGY